MVALAHNPDTCFEACCTGEGEVTPYLSKREQLERLVSAYVPTGDDSLDGYNRERIANGETPIDAESFRKAYRAATDMEIETMDTSVRTRYAQPGQRSGNGVVRLVSGKQVNFIKRLMRERDTSALVRLPGSENIERMSLTGARDLITRLLCCPELPFAVEARNTIRMATEKQWGWLRKLTDRECEGAVFRIRAQAVCESDWELTEVTFDDARVALDVLFKAPRIREESKPKAERITEGMYRAPDGRIIKVQAARGSGNLYAKLWELFDEPEDTKKGKKYGEFVFVSGLIREVRPEWRMTLDEAKAHGVEFHFCIRCGIELTNPESIENGIGPICISKI